MASPQTWVVRFAAIVLLAAAVATVEPKWREFWAVDSCADAGGTFDYIAQACRFDVQAFPVQPRRFFNKPDERSGRAAKVIAVVLLFAFVIKDMRRRDTRAAA